MSSTVVAPVRVTDAVAVLEPEKSADVEYSIVAVPDEAPEPKEETFRVTTPRVTVSDGATVKEKSGAAESTVVTDFTAERPVSGASLTPRTRR